MQLCIWNCTLKYLPATAAMYCGNLLPFDFEDILRMPKNGMLKIFVLQIVKNIFRII